MPKYNSGETLAPMRLLKQIILLQTIYYLVAIALIAFTLIIGGESFSFKTVFSWEPIRFDTTLGWTLSMLWLLDTFFSVLAMTYIVGRSKLALDFTLTLHGINVIVAWLVASKFPTSLMWWSLQGFSTLLMVSLGTWTSQWRELSITFFDVESSGAGGAYEMVPVAPTQGSTDATTVTTVVSPTTSSPTLPTKTASSSSAQSPIIPSTTS